jgi:acetyl-CoA synthetase
MITDMMKKITEPSLIHNGQYNIAHICTKQQCDSGMGGKTAVRWISPNLERTDYSYLELERKSNQIANALTRLGMSPGDRVFTYLPRSPELFFIFLGTLKIQAVSGVLFSNFGEEALLDRLGDSAARLLFTRKNYLRKIRSIWSNLPALEKVIVVDLPDDESGRVLSFSRLISTSEDEYLAPQTPGETPSVLHYTSGSTGKSKGVQHVHRSILSQAATFCNILSVQPDDIYWCTADPGWVTGVSYGIIGPLSQGVTQIQFRGNFQADTWFEILQDEKVNIWYTAPTALRMLMKEDEALFRRFDLGHLRHIFSVGEPLNPAVIEWAQRILRKDIYDTWWQTETGAIMISNRPGLPIRPGSMGMPCEGVQAEILDEKGMPLPAMEQGRLCLQPGWPSMFVSYINRESQYANRFKNGLYDTGDMAYRDHEGYYWFIGRSDDVINTAGHLVGPFEVESALLEMDEIAEAGVIGAPDELLYEKVVAYIRLKQGVEWTRELEIKLRLHISNRVSSVATPQEFRMVDAIPKNKSGKIMRRVLKAWFTGTEAGDLSTMED